MRNFFKKYNFFTGSPVFPENYTPSIAQGHRVYCIGDIHGRLDLLQKLHHLIDMDAKAFNESLSLVYVGDYIDRGPDSCQVVDYLLTNPMSRFRSIYLMGNHEQVLLEFLNDYRAPSVGMWLNFGGLATLGSYSVQLQGIPSPKDLVGIRLELLKKIPHSHIKFYRDLMYCHEIDDYYFVHAGVKPKVKLHKQVLKDQLWIRDEFLNSDDFLGKVIVHGHSVIEKPEIKKNRIAIDTGAYHSEKLTSVVLEGNRVRFLTT